MISNPCPGSIFFARQWNLHLDTFGAWDVRTFGTSDFFLDGAIPVER